MIASYQTKAFQPIDRHPASDNSVNAPGSTIDLSRLPVRPLKNLTGERSASFQVVILQSALDRIHALAAAWSPEEICGVLVGELYSDSDSIPYLLVDHIIPLESARGIGRASFSPEVWRHVETVMDYTYPDRKIVGWYFTHPNQGVFMSALDRFLHEGIFKLPWQCGLSHDPVNSQYSLFSAFSGSLRNADFIVEADAPALTNTAAQAGLAATSNRRGWSLAKTYFLASVVMGLFGVMGYLLGALLLQVKDKLPPLPIHF